MSKFTSDVASRFFSPAEQMEARLWARFDCQTFASHHLQKAQAHLADARRHDPNAVAYWEASVCTWIDRAYKAQNNVDMFRAFVCECGYSAGY